MKTAKRFISLSIAMLLLCALLTACASRQGASSTSQQGGSSAPQQELSELDLIKAEWQRYVIDRTEKVTYAGVAGPALSSHASLAIEEQTVIDEVLDICQTLNTAEIMILDDHPDSILQYSLNVCLGIKELPDTDGNGIYILLIGTDEAYLHFVTEDMDLWAYISGWPVYEQLEEYRYYNPTKEDK